MTAMTKTLVHLCITITSLVVVLRLRSTLLTATEATSMYAGCLWSLIQIVRSLVPIRNVMWFNHHVDLLEEKSWLAWETMNTINYTVPLYIPTLDMNLLTICLETNKSATFCCNELLGDGWIQYPLLIRKLWTEEELDTPNRQLSIHGLQSNLHLANMIIPYYSDSSRKIGSTTAGYNYLSPDASSTIGDIIYNITTMDSKAKIATQLIVEKHPDLIQEILPPPYIHIISELFGNVFQPQHLEATGPFGMFPAWTTVPIFIANSRSGNRTNTQQSSSECLQQDNNHPRTDLHCEPIGNIAVQLQGQKRWSLVSPKYSIYLRPSVSRHGRAFFFSILQDTSDLNHVPHYQVITETGDALWVPPWTWHKVDYDQERTADGSKSVSMAASLFHFRPYEFYRNQPLFAIMIIPNLIKELVGWKTE